jgi:hypothetical protein
MVFGKWHPSVGRCEFYKFIFFRVLPLYSFIGSIQVICITSILTLNLWPLFGPNVLFCDERGRTRLLLGETSALGLTPRRKWH